MEGAKETSVPVDTRITLEKVAVNVGYYLLPESDLAPAIVV